MLNIIPWNMCQQDGGWYEKSEKVWNDMQLKFLDMAALRSITQASLKRNMDFSDANNTYLNIVLICKQ